MYDLIKTWRGKESIIMTDTFANINQRMRLLRRGSRKGIKRQVVNYSLRESSGIKFKEKPHDRVW